MLGGTIDQRVSPIVSRDINTAIRKEQEETLLPVLRELTRQINGRLDTIEGREYELETGFGCGYEFDQPLVVTRVGNTEPICIVDAS